MRIPRLWRADVCLEKEEELADCCFRYLIVKILRSMPAVMIKRHYILLMTILQDKRHYILLMTILQDKRHYILLMTILQDKRHYIMLMTILQDKRHYILLMTILQDKRHFILLMTILQDKRHYILLMTILQDKRHYILLMKILRDKRHCNLLSKFKRHYCQKRRYSWELRRLTSCPKECQLITPFPSHNFTYQSAWLWNKFKSVNRSINFSLTTIKIKNILKYSLLEAQNTYNGDNWCEYNFTKFAKIDKD